jgi:hypothetical protein
LTEDSGDRKIISKKSLVRFYHPERFIVKNQAVLENPMVISLAELLLVSTAEKRRTSSSDTSIFDLYLLQKNAIDY